MRTRVQQVSGYLAGVLRGRSPWVLAAATGGISLVSRATPTSRVWPARLGSLSMQIIQVSVWVVMAGRQAMRNVQEYEQQKTEHWSRRTVFASGFSSALVLVGCVQLCRPRLYPSPEKVFRQVLPMLRASREVRTVVGSQLQPGMFRAYSQAGGLQWSSRTWYQTHSLQLMFQLNGEISSAMVSVDVERQAWLGHQLHFRSLAVDLPTGERLLLKGSDAAVVFQGYTRLR